MSNPVLAKQFGHPETANAPIVTEAGDRMTIRSVLSHTGILFAILIVAAAFGWSNAEAIGPLFWGALIGSIVLMIATIARPQWVRVTAPLYAITQGVLVGAISSIYSDVFDGIVVQAVLATFAVFLAMLFLYANRIIKVTEKLRSTIVLATVGVFLFYLISIGLSFFGVDMPFVWDGGPLSIALSVGICGIAAFNLLLDFDLVERGIAEGAPAWMSWFAAFGLMVTIVWLYLEILRLLALTRD